MALCNLLLILGLNMVCAACAFPYFRGQIEKVAEELTKSMTTVAA